MDPTLEQRLRRGAAPLGVPLDDRIVDSLSRYLDLLLFWNKTVNLTASLPVKFFNEDYDAPSTPNSYGSAGWTKDGASVLI